MSRKFSTIFPLRLGVLVVLALVAVLLLGGCEKNPMDSDGPPPRYRVIDMQPAWSPDGQTIVFTNTVDGRFWIMDAGGANWRQLTFEP